MEGARAGGAAVGVHGQFADVWVLYVCVDPCGYSRLCGSCRVLWRSTGASGNAARMHTHHTSCSNCPWRCHASVAVVTLQQLLVKLLPALVQKLATTQPKTRAKVKGKQLLHCAPWEEHQQVAARSHIYPFTGGSVSMQLVALGETSAGAAGSVADTFAHGMPLPAAATDLGAVEPHQQARQGPAHYSPAAAATGERPWANCCRQERRPGRVL